MIQFEKSFLFQIYFQSKSKINFFKETNESF